jgi:ribosomal protein L20A (L18A)
MAFHDDNRLKKNSVKIKLIDEISATNVARLFESKAFLNQRILIF